MRPGHLSRDRCARFGRNSKNLNKPIISTWLRRPRQSRFRHLPHLSQHWYDLCANLCMMRAASSPTVTMSRRLASNEGTTVGLGMAVILTACARIIAQHWPTGAGDATTKNRADARIAIAD
jgi:hypothetical protein